MRRLLLKGIRATKTRPFLSHLISTSTSLVGCSFLVNLCIMVRLDTVLGVEGPTNFPSCSGGKWFGQDELLQW